MDSLNLVYRDKPRFCLHNMCCFTISSQDMVDVTPSPLTLRPVSKPLFSTSKSAERKLNTSHWECKEGATLTWFYLDFTMIWPRCVTGVSHFCQQTVPGHGPLAHGCRRAAMTPLGFPVVPEVKKQYAKVWPAPWSDRCPSSRWLFTSSTVVT